MYRALLSRSRGASALAALVLLWILLRLVYDQVIWHRRETTLSCLSEGDYRVLRVIDGYTLLLSPSSREGSAGGANSPWGAPPRARVCLLGVGQPPTPQLGREPSGTNYAKWQDEADRFTRRFVAGGTVRLRLDRRRINRGRVFVAYVFVRDRMLNEELVRRGWARVDVRPRDSSAMVNRLRTAEQEAREHRRGFWSGKNDLVLHQAQELG
jgi:endonuclease YncB( thermonuclease family)